MRRITSIIGSLVLFTLLSGCTPTSPADIVACDPAGCISEAKFSTYISNVLKNQVEGYVVIVGGLPSVFGGTARAPIDPPSTAMLPDLLTNVASVSKILTTVVALQVLAKDGLTIDTSISHYIYPDWYQDPSISQITFRDLLSQRSGFRYGCPPTAPCGCPDTSYSGLQSLLTRPVMPSNIGSENYDNCNFALFRELLPGLLGMTLTSSGPIRANQSASLYISYMNQNVLQPVGIPQRECMPPPPGSFDILSYPSPLGSPNPSGTFNGTDWGNWTLNCGGGGWMLSAGDLFKVINDLANGNVLLTTAEKALMNTPNYLGWDNTVLRNCPYSYPCKNGDLAWGNVAIWTYVGIFKCTVPVVVVVNSFLPPPYQPYDSNENPIMPNSGDIIGLVRDGYDAAAVSNPPAPCPSGGENGG